MAQQTHPPASSNTSSSLCKIILVSIEIRPNSFTKTAIREECSKDKSSLSTVVFPEPKKPVRIKKETL